ncbi:MAG: DUF559 domain-containing protein [Actinomycetota bacterium]|nr:DUF559 domain-containing protein [Actinomycetota bacterium]
MAPAEGLVDCAVDPKAPVDCAVDPKASIDCAVDPKAPVDLAVARIADEQKGLVTQEQLLGCGLSRHAIGRRRARGWLRVVHRGVYAVGHTALPELALQMAAVLACGDRALLSHHSAASVWNLRAPMPEAEVDVTVVGRNCGCKKGIRIHRVQSFAPADMRRHQGIPISSPARALLEVAPSLSDRELERALDGALVRRLVTRDGIRAVLARNPRRRGSVRLAALALAGAGATTTMTRSEAEERFLALVRKACLPPPEVNARLGRYEADFLWRAERLVVEIDGFAFHGDRGASERDRRRDAELAAARFTVLRFTWRQHVSERELILVRLGQVMATIPRAAAE